MDVVVTVPKKFGLQRWIDEGDAAGEPWSGNYWEYTTFGFPPDMKKGERVYVVCEGRLRGYSPLVDLLGDPRAEDGGKTPRSARQPLTFVRAGGAVAVTIDEKITGFRGWRYRWWEREQEHCFPEWKRIRPPNGVVAQVDTQKD